MEIKGQFLAVLEKICPHCGITSLQIVKLNCCFIHVLCRRERFFLASNYLCTYLTSNYIHTEVHSYTLYLCTKLITKGAKTFMKLPATAISRQHGNSSSNPSWRKKLIFSWNCGCEKDFFKYRPWIRFVNYSSKPKCHTMCRVFRSVNTRQLNF